MSTAPDFAYYVLRHKSDLDPDTLDLTNAAVTFDFNSYWDGKELNLLITWGGFENDDYGSRTYDDRVVTDLLNGFFSQS